MDYLLYEFLGFLVICVIIFIISVKNSFSRYEDIIEATVTDISPYNRIWSLDKSKTIFGL